MSHTHTSLLCHVVFAPKSRTTQIKPAIRQRLYEYLGGTSRNIGCKTVGIGGTTDHVHIVVYLTPGTTVEDYVRVVKCNSSKWIHGEFPGFQAFSWQTGYSAFTVSRSGLNGLLEYVNSQEEHHRTMSFQEELRRLCEKHGIAYRPPENDSEGGVPEAVAHSDHELPPQEQDHAGGGRGGR